MLVTKKNKGKKYLGPSTTSLGPSLFSRSLGVLGRACRPNGWVVAMVVVVVAVRSSCYEGVNGGADRHYGSGGGDGPLSSFVIKVPYK
jgi:hypothetical protein